jgi:hypothetical protein
MVAMKARRFSPYRRRRKSPNREIPYWYTAAHGEQAVIKGSEVVESWERVEGTMWRA